VTGPIGVLLAAGLGTRLRPLTLARPKPLVPLHGIPLLEFGLRQLEAAGCRLVAVNGHHLAGMLRDWLEGRQRRHPDTELRFFAEPVLLGVGGGLARMARELPPGPLLVQNGDVLHNGDLARLRAAAQGAEIALVLGGEPHVAEWRDGRVAGLRDPLRSTHGFTGIHLWSGAGRARLEAWSRPDLIPLLQQEMAAGREPLGLRLAEDGGGSLWEDLGHLSRYLPLHRELMAREDYRRLLADLGLRPAWDEARGTSVGAGSRLPDDARDCVAWDGVDWEGAATGCVFLDGVRGSGRSAGEIVLAGRKDRES